MKTYRYEALDSMEYIVALTDCLDDAIYAANKHEAKLIYDRVTRSFVPFENKLATVNGDLIANSVTRAEALAISNFSRRPVIWGTETINSEYSK